MLTRFDLRLTNRGNGNPVWLAWADDNPGTRVWLGNKTVRIIDKNIMQIGYEMEDLILVRVNIVMVCMISCWMQFMLR